MKVTNQSWNKEEGNKVILYRLELGDQKPHGQPLLTQQYNSILYRYSVHDFYIEQPFPFCQIMLGLKISPQENPFQIPPKILKAVFSLMFLFLEIWVDWWSSGVVECFWKLLSRWWLWWWWAPSSKKTNSNSHFNLEMLQINLPSAVYIVRGAGE